jgi:hypothetical protein
MIGGKNNHFDEETSCLDKMRLILEKKKGSGN